MIIAICIIAYILMGLLSEYMIGYANPQTQMSTSTLSDWYSFVLWFKNFPSTVGNYGAARRIRE